MGNYNITPIDEEGNFVTPINQFYANDTANGILIYDEIMHCFTKEDDYKIMFFSKSNNSSCILPNITVKSII